MEKIDLKMLDNQELFELLNVLEGINDVLEEKEENHE